MWRKRNNYNYIEKKQVFSLKKEVSFQVNIIAVSYSIAAKIVKVKKNFVVVHFLE